MAIDPLAYARRWKTLAVLSLALLDHRARQHDPQCRAAEPAGGVRRFVLDAAVDRRLLPARVRRPAADHGHARRSLRPQARAAGRPRAVRRRQPRRAVRRLRQPADRDPRRDGRRRRADHAGDALDHLERLPARGAQQGDRHLVRHGARSASASARCSAACCSSASTGPRSSWSTSPSPRRPPGRPGSSREPRSRAGRVRLPGALLSIAALVSLVYGVIEAPERGLDRPADPRLLRRRRGAAVGLRRWELRTPRADAEPPFFRNPRFSVASVGDQHRVLLAVRRDLRLTQFLQDAHGYSALEAGAAMVPLALGLVVGAGSSIKLVAKLGTTQGRQRPASSAWRVLLASTLVWSARHALLAARPVVLRRRAVDGLDHGPGDRLGHGRRARGEVRRRLRDERRHPPGRRRARHRRDRLADHLALRLADRRLVAALPEPARVAAEDSVGQANAVAAKLPAEQGASLAETAADAFTELSASASPSPARSRCSRRSRSSCWLPDRPHRARAPRRPALAPALAPRQPA